MKNECRNCGRQMEVGEDVYIEIDECHCDDCHSILFTDDEWNALYDEYNEVDENSGNYKEGCGDSYYYTEIQEGEETELFN